MDTIRIPRDYQHISPAGAEVRVLMCNAHGGIAHCTLKSGKISKAVQHKTVSEFWHILSGRGMIWRKSQEGEESVTLLVAGTTIDIPLGSKFQYRSEEDLVFICITMPPWPGADEVIYVEKGAWEPS